VFRHVSVQLATSHPLQNLQAKRKYTNWPIDICTLAIPLKTHWSQLLASTPFELRLSVEKKKGKIVGNGKRRSLASTLRDLAIILLVSCAFEMLSAASVVIISEAVTVSDI